MPTFMVVATFDPETDLPQMRSVIAEEVAQVKVLEGEGRLTSLHISSARGTVFLGIAAGDADEALATVHTLPMAKWWTIDVYPTDAPPAQ